ncbi:non-ribosomal peptide synthetase [Actinokineospora diospyrosa]|uniref:Nonribosomal peptide synthetase CepB n=1 Tax=Actinokineospora diospyrosa TaxID=103728 RepID=A0ABT1ILP7_9PSEU|nr:non-ribosomal peptide synthetase [Actinokineospora diospyrosa]MCP2273579.1 nonribosomal peptide synthetase CepB [Actinokineospora diospyrosa]
MNTRKSGLEDVLPLSPLQQGLLFHSEYATEADDPYLVQFVLDLEGPLEPAVLKVAAQALIDRHANLRACFRRRKNGEVLAPVPRVVELPWSELDLDESDWDGVLAADRVERFDLAQAPLLRVLLAKLGPNRHRLLLTYHHILLDGWSTPLLARELFQLYTAKGDASKLPAVRPYKDYLSWLRNKDADAARSTWAEALRGVEEPTLLAPGADPSGSAEQTPIALPDGLLDGMANLGRSAGVTLNTVVQAAWALLLARTLGRQDVVFGATVSGRPADLPGVESMIGLFINTVPVRVRLDPAETVTALLARVQAEQARVMDHQQLGLADIQRTVGIGELFDTLTVFESYFVDTAALESAEAATGLRVRAGETRDATHYPATLVATGGELLLKYRPGLVDPDALATRLVRVLSALVADPTSPVAKIDGLSDTERGNLVHGWNPTGQRGAAATIPARFAEQVGRAPEALALVAGSERLTYAELDARSDRLARVLVERGARPGGIVAIGLPRSANLVVAVLAVLKSGAAYLPLDPSYPRARLDLMLADAAPTLLVSDLDDFDVPTVSPTDSTIGTDEPLGQVELSPDNPAYVIYTSGSTGTPKGVLVPHRTVDRLLSATDHWFGFGANDVWTLFHSYAFDFSVWELWGALLRGGTLVVVDHATSRSPEAFLELLERERVTVLNQTPSAFHQLDAADAARGGVDLALRYVIFGGEALEPRKLASWFERHADDAPRLVNMYGITETTVHVTYLPLTRASAAEGTPDIGVPIPDLRAYVLDDGLGLTAPGVVGELYVAGEGLADGYLNRPGLTSTRFVANPFGQGRLYRSGDLARWRSDGTLEYFGRADGQVKLRGFRIELGEIEAVLSAHPDVAHAVAVVREDRTTRLVAYVVPTAGAALEGLREWAARDLPEHMVPAAVVVLDRIPLTPNGKVDRAALPAPDFAGLTTARQAETEAERTLAAVFAEVLGVPTVGMDDDFFALGGDSIISIQLVARARAEGLRFSPRDVFERRTVARLAEVATEPAAVVTTSGTGTLPLTPIMRELLGRGGPITRVAQARLLIAPAGLTPAKLTAAVQSVVDTHDVLRSRLVGAELEVRPVGSVTAAVRQVEGTDFAAEAARSYAELDPAAGEVLRVVWFAPDRLLIIAHHLVVDGVSWRIIVPDLADAVEGKALAPVGTSFREWATALAAQDRATELDYWRTALEGIGGRRIVPTRDTVSTVRSVRVSVSQETTARLLGAVPAAYHAGVEDVLLTALTLALASTRGVPWHVVDREGHGRVEDAVPGADLHRTVGWFTTLHPVRLDLSGVDIADAVAGGPAAGLALKQVKELLRAVPGDGIGFGLLRDSLPAASPEVLFNYLGRFGSPGSAAGSAVAWSGAPEAAALGGDANPELPASHPLTINAVTADGALTATFSWPAALFDQAEVDRLAAAWVSALDAIDRHAATGATGRTPSDFPLVDLGQGEVDALVEAHPGLVDVWRPTPLQQGIAFLSRFDDTGTDVYTVQFACELTGPLDPARLRAAGQALLDRHDTLRAAIAHIGSGDPVLVVQPQVDLPWREVDGSDWDEVVAQDQQTRFDVTTAPLVRFTLGKVSEDYHRLLLSFHHVLLDGWSTPLLVRELFELYAGNALPAVRPYRDFLNWLSQRDAGVQPWAEALAGAESTLVAPAGAARSGALPRRVELALPEGLSQVARECGVTLNTLVQAAWGLTVARGLGRQDVVFGATVSGRPADLPGVESMIGLFINTLPVRVRLDPAETVAALLTRVQAEQAALLDHQHVGLADIHRAVGVGELFDTLTVFESFPIDTAALDRAETAAGFQVSGVTGADATNYPITLTVGAGLSAWLDVRDDLISAELVTAWAERFVRAISAFAAPGTRVRDLDLMSNEERSAVVVAGPVVEVTDSSVLDVLARQDSSTRAVVGPDAELTYGELAARSDQIAGLLQSRGVQPGDVVALALPPSAGLIAAIIGVWKAGAAYLVLDPEYPADRLRHMVEQARPALTLTIAAVGLPGAVEIDSVSGYSFTGGPVSGAAYVIFTSGSTGRPKGVLVEHAGLVNLLASHQASVMRPGSVLQAASFSFDASLDPLLWMIAGHEMHVVAEPSVAYVRDNGIAYVDAAPSLLGQLVSDGLLSSGVSVVGTGGEAIGSALWAELAASSVEAFNFYGPTECTVDAVVAPVVGSDVVIGRPVANSTVYVLDSALGLVAPGVVGELYVGGPGVARGYLGQPGLTASRFVANPFGAGRLYRTGDLVRWSAGSLEFLGRLDDQVKVRGFRVELGEVETVLAEHPAVTAAIATVRDGRLIAHVIGTTDLRAHAASLLPDHMVPSAFVAVDEFPLQPNGKVDRAALPDPDFAALVSARAATTEVEATLVEIFAAVLGLPTVGVDDDFFALGGDSIVSIQLVSRARAEGLRFSPRDVFEQRTVAALALIAEPDKPTPIADDGTGLIPFTPIMRSLLEVGGPIGRFAQVQVLRAPADLTAARLVVAVQKLVDTHSVLRAQLVSDGLQVPDSLDAVDVVSRVSGPLDVDSVLDSLDPCAGSMIRVAWFPDASNVVVAVHHLVVDGVSWRILLPDLVAAYGGAELEPVGTSFRGWALGLTEAARARGEELAHWRAAVAGDAAPLGDRELDGDKVSQLKQVVTTVPDDVAEPLLGAVPELFHAEVDDILLTGFALGLARWSARYRGQQRSAITVDLESHGRDEDAVPGADLHRTVGWFTSVYPVRLDLAGVDVADAVAGGPAAGRAVKQVKECLRATPGSGIGFGLLRHLNPELGSRQQVLFNYLGRFDTSSSTGPWSSLPGIGGGADADMPAEYPLQVDITTIDGPEFRIAWTYPDGVFTERDIRDLATCVAGALRAVAEHSAEAGAGGLTPSDLLVPGFAQEQIDRFEANWRNL